MTTGLAGKPASHCTSPPPPPVCVSVSAQIFLKSTQHVDFLYYVAVIRTFKKSPCGNNNMHKLNPDTVLLLKQLSEAIKASSHTLADLFPPEDTVSPLVKECKHK